MKSIIFTSTLALILTSCAGVQKGSLFGGSPVINAVSTLDAKLNTLKDQFGKPEMKDSSLKIASEVETLAVSSSKDLEPPGLAEIKNKEEASDMKKDFKGLLAYLGKTAKAYGTSVKDNDTDIAKEDLANAVEIMAKIKKMSDVK